MELADRREESAEDITAAAMAPNPATDTYAGQRYCNTKGRIMFDSFLLYGEGKP